MIHIQKQWQCLFIIYFSLFLLANFIFPVSFDDDFAYSISGNPFLLQWKEYTYWHGRIISHSLLRIILQLKIADFVIALLSTFIPFVAYFLVYPKYLQSKSVQELLIFNLLALLLYSFISISWTAYAFATYTMSNFFAKVLIIIFFIPYRILLEDKNYSPNYKWFTISAFFAGTIHEIGIVVLPLMIFWYIIYRIIHSNQVPKWFYTGILFYCLGLLVIFLAPSMIDSSYRIENYTDVKNWIFQGNTYNWLELGYLKYWYSLLQAFFTSTFAYIPNAFVYIVFLFTLWWLNIKKSKFSTTFYISLLMFIFSIGCISVMMFSPLYYSANLNWGLYFLFIALIIAYREYLLNNNYNTLKLSSTIIVSLSITIYILCFLSWNQYRIEYNNVITLIDKAKQNQSLLVEVPKFTQFSIKTPFGSITPVYLYRNNTFYTRMAEYYQSPPIVIK